MTGPGLSYTVDPERAEGLEQWGSHMVSMHLYAQSPLASLGTRPGVWSWSSIHLPLSCELTRDTAGTQECQRGHIPELVRTP